MGKEIEDIRRKLEVLDSRVAVEQRRIHDMTTEIMSLWERMNAIERRGRSGKAWRHEEMEQGRVGEGERKDDSQEEGG